MFSVPVIVALGGGVFLGESLNMRLVLASVAILGGIAQVILENKTRLNEEDKGARPLLAFVGIHELGEICPKSLK